MKTWLKAMPPAARPAVAVYFVLLAAAIVSGGVAVLGVSYWLRSGLAIVLFVPVVAYIAARLYLNFVLLPLVTVLTPVKATEEPVGGNRMPNEERIHDAMNALDTLGGAAPQWADAAVREWLATPEGIERDRKRNALLERLYAYSSSSHDDYAQRAAANRLRLAINPWVDGSG